MTTLKCWNSYLSTMSPAVECLSRVIGRVLMRNWGADTLMIGSSMWAWGNWEVRVFSFLELMFTSLSCATRPSGTIHSLSDLSIRSSASLQHCTATPSSAFSPLFPSRILKQGIDSTWDGYQNRGLKTYWNLKATINFYKKLGRLGCR